MPRQRTQIETSAGWEGAYNLGDEGGSGPPVNARVLPRLSRSTRLAVTDPSSRSREEPSEQHSITGCRAFVELIGGSDRNTGGKRGIGAIGVLRREATSIAAFTQPCQATLALDFQATRETAASRPSHNIASSTLPPMAMLDSEHREPSGLVLSLVGADGKPRDGFLDLEDIYNLTLTSDLLS